MSDSWEHAKGLAKQLQRELPEHSDIDGALQALLVQSAAHALRARARATRMRRARAVGGVAACVAVAAAAVFMWRGPSFVAAEPTPLARRETAPALLDGDLRLERPDHAAVSVAPGALGPTAAGTVLRSGPRTTLQLATTSLELRDAVVRVESFGKSAAFVLDAGVVGLDATTDERFTVRTPDATAQGANARFLVERAGSECGRTRVSVQRGVIDVRTERGVETIAAGDSWTDCEHTAAPRPTPAAVHDHTLDDQNDALAAAVSARRRGRTDEALQAYGRFLRRWPSGPLSEVARADRMNLLATRDPNAAARAAREYLRLHPNGPAAERARELSKKGPE